MTRASYERGNEARGQITNVASDESLHPHETGKHLSSPVMQLAQLAPGRISISSASRPMHASGDPGSRPLASDPRVLEGGYAHPDSRPPPPERDQGRRTQSNKLAAAHRSSRGGPPAFPGQTVACRTREGPAATRFASIRRVCRRLCADADAPAHACLR